MKRSTGAVWSVLAAASVAPLGCSERANGPRASADTPALEGLGPTQPGAAGAGNGSLGSGAAPGPAGMATGTGPGVEGTNPNILAPAEGEAPAGSAGADGVGAGPLAPPLGFARNPIVSHIFTADPSARVFEGRVYVYASHDPDDQAAYDMRDYHVFSSQDLVNWQDHGVALDEADISWTDRLYAPDCAYNAATGKYYLYFPNSGSAIGVAVSDSPAGPFVDALGRPLIDNSVPGVADVEWIFDPTAFVDDDGQAYLYFGGGPEGTGANARVIRLNPDMVSLMDAAATVIPAPDFFEASYLHKRDGKYYFSYSTGFTNHAPSIDYMVSDNPMTGFSFAGTMLPNPAGNNGNNNHSSIVEYGGSWYIFYHNRVLANRDGFTSFQRSITLDHLNFDAQGNIVMAPAQGGRVAQLQSVDAFSRIEAEAMADQRGVEVEFALEGGTRVGVNVTSLEGQDWIGYSQLDFRGGASSFRARVSSAAPAGGAIEVYLDGCEAFSGQPGTLIGTCSVESSGGPQNWRDVECPAAASPGVHDLCLRFAGAAGMPLLNLDYFSFQ